MNSPTLPTRRSAAIVTAVAIAVCALGATVRQAHPEPDVPTPLLNVVHTTRFPYCPDGNYGIASDLRLVGVPTRVRVNTNSEPVWASPLQQCRLAMVQDAAEIADFIAEIVPTESGKPMRFFALQSRCALPTIDRYVTWGEARVSFMGCHDNTSVYYSGGSLKWAADDSILYTPRTAMKDVGTSRDLEPVYDVVGEWNDRNVERYLQ